MKKFCSLILSFLLCVISFSILCSCTGGTNSDETITVTDMLGEKIEVKANPTKVACISRTTYDLLIAFGLGDYIDGVYKNLLNNDWAGTFDSKASTRYKYAYEESYETFISRGVDLVFSPEKYITDGLKERGIKALNVSLYGNPDFSNYVYYFADLVKTLWADVDGVAERVDNWKSVFSDVQATISTELAKHNDKKRTLYYVRGDKNNGIGYTDTGKSFTEWAYKFLGFDYVSNRFNTTKPSAEAICEVNPDVVVIGGTYQATLINQIKTTEPYVNLKAVKNDQVFNIPVGLTMFEQISVFSPAFLCDQANKLYPDYFNFNVKTQVQELSKDFFGVTLTDTEATNMLNGLAKNGSALA